jgi:hypothetical protein
MLHLPQSQQQSKILYPTVILWGVKIDVQATLWVKVQPF